MFEIKIVLKSGYIGFFTVKTIEKQKNEEAKKELKNYISDSIKNNANGTIELAEKETGLETLINFQEIALFGVKEIESEDK